MNPHIERIYTSSELVAADGRTFVLNSEISEKEGAFITNCILTNAQIKRTLEIGCAFGLSSLFICEALRGRSGSHHTILDPFQSSQWGGLGIKHLTEAGIDFFELIETPSEYAMPKLAQERPASFDLIFVDGWHTFDHTMVDCFYATKLLAVGGILIVDDANMPSVRRTLEFLKCFPCYEFVGQSSVARRKSLPRRIAIAATLPLRILGVTRFLRADLLRKIFEDEYPTMMAFKKVSLDERNWDWDTVAL